MSAGEAGVGSSSAGSGAASGAATGEAGEAELVRSDHERDGASEPGRVHGADGVTAAPTHPHAGVPGDLSGPAPGVLSQVADPAPLPPPLHDAEEIATLHVSWARLAAGGGEREEPAPPSGVRAKVRARVVAAASASVSQDRALIGDLIRAADALAKRLDEVSERVHGVELLVQEVVDRLSEDVVRLQAAVESARPGTPGSSSHAGSDAESRTGASPAADADGESADP